MTIVKKSLPKKTRTQLLDEALPQFEQFIESRECYIKALETTIEALRRENLQFNKNNLAIRSSIDELVAMQRLSNTISTATHAEHIVDTLIDLTRQVIPVLESNIFLFDSSVNKLFPLDSGGSVGLQRQAQQQLESGIVDWVLSEKKVVIIPNLEHLVANGRPRNFVIVPLILRNQAIGIYLIHTEKPQQEFSNQDIQLLSVLANQAAAGVENWRTYEQLVRTNEELKASQAQTIQAAKLAAIGELAANVVHEIKNPVQILMMHFEILQRGKPLPNWTELLGQQVRRLSEITKRLMNFARNASEDLRMEPVNINKVIEDTVTMVQYEFRNEKIAIELSLADDLPCVIGHESYLQQVFLNLMINARDAMPNGGTISIATILDGRMIKVQFADTGMGIEKKNLENIFKPFFTTKEAGKGTGLGLSICSKIVAQHHGEIKVESEVGKGTTFHISLPVGKTAR